MSTPARKTRGVSKSLRAHIEAMPMISSAGVDWLIGAMDNINRRDPTWDGLALCKVALKIKCKQFNVRCTAGKISKCANDVMESRSVWFAPSAIWGNPSIVQCMLLPSQAADTWRAIMLERINDGVFLGRRVAEQVIEDAKERTRERKEREEQGSEVTESVCARTCDGCDLALCECSKCAAGSWTSRFQELDRQCQVPEEEWQWWRQWSNMTAIGCE